MYQINEETARRALEQNSMYSYTAGSATAEYNASVEAFRAFCEDLKPHCIFNRAAKLEKLDALAEEYARRLAQWTNDTNANDARHVAWFVSGPANYNMRKHNAWSARNDTLMQGYPDREHYEYQARHIVTDNAVQAGDPHAAELLREKIKSLDAGHQLMKDANAYYIAHKTLEGCPGINPETAEWLNRPGVFNYGKNGTPLEMYGRPFPTYSLSGNRAEARRLRERLEKLEAVKAAEPVTQETPEGITYEEDAETMRVRLVFDGKPDEETRAILKANGFRWAPSVGAWQRQLTENGKTAARRVLAEIAKEG